jgi:site-specific DNA-methyltransferase (adenine-specific)
MQYTIDHSFTGTRIIHGDTFEVLKSFPNELFSGIITDPPYSSGAADQNARTKSTAQKYSSVKISNPLPDFEGDAKDQRSWTNWMTEWLVEARRCTKPGAPICMFIDWRQLPSMTDALQWAGWIWRGIVVWDKTNSRPQRGRFRQQAEFVVWGSNGNMPIDRKAPILPGVFRQAMPPFQKRIHQTEKPIEIMRDIVKIVERETDRLPAAQVAPVAQAAPVAQEALVVPIAPFIPAASGGIILDPFAGAGTTILAAALEGYSAVGIELTKHYADAAANRIEMALNPAAAVASDEKSEPLAA